MRRMVMAASVAKRSDLIFEMAGSTTPAPSTLGARGGTCKAMGGTPASAQAQALALDWEAELAAELS